MIYVLTSENLGSDDKVTSKTKDPDNFVLCLTHGVHSIPSVQKNKWTYIIDLFYTDGMVNESELVSHIDNEIQFKFHPVSDYQSAMDQIVDIASAQSNSDEANTIAIAVQYNWSIAVARAVRTRLVSDSLEERNNGREPREIDVLNLYQYLKTPSQEKLANLVTQQLGVELDFTDSNAMAFGYLLAYVLYQSRL